MMRQRSGIVYGGFDTHLDVHVAAVIDSTGRVLGTKSFPTSPLGLRQLERWLAGGRIQGDSATISASFSSAIL